MEQGRIKCRIAHKSMYLHVYVYQKILYHAQLVKKEDIGLRFCKYTSLSTVE